MLEYVLRWLGALSSDVRAGHAGLAIVQRETAVGETAIDLSSPAFANGARLPERFTTDGEGMSPPLLWGAVPSGTESIALLVEDPDAPAPNPLVHALVWNLPPDARHLAEGAVRRDGNCGEIGRNSYFAQGWLPPDPPTGHGSHDYVFQLFALSGHRSQSRPIGLCRSASRPGTRGRHPHRHLQPGRAGRDFRCGTDTAGGSLIRTG